MPGPSWPGRRTLGELSRHPQLIYRGVRGPVAGNLLLGVVCRSLLVCPCGREACLRRTYPWGTQWGQMESRFRGSGRASAGRGAWGAGGVSFAGNPSCHRSLPGSFSFSGELPLARRGSAAWAFQRIVTWLILPVVICLSQRLSHACLSISNLYGETANGSLNQLSFI